MTRTLTLLLLLAHVLPAVADDELKPPLARLGLVGQWDGVELTPGLPLFPQGKLVRRTMTIRPRLAGTLLEWRQTHTPPDQPAIEILDLLRYDLPRDRYQWDRFSNMGNRATFDGALRDKTLALELVHAPARKRYDWTIDGDHILLERWQFFDGDRAVLLGRGYLHRKGAQPRWTQVARGWIHTGGQQGHKRIATAEDWKAYRAEHQQVAMQPGVQKLIDEPLPDHDFARGQLVLIWTGTLREHPRLHAVSRSRVVLDAFRPRGERGARPEGVGNFVLLAIRDSSDDISVGWVR